MFHIFKKWLGQKPQIRRHQQSGFVALTTTLQPRWSRRDYRRFAEEGYKNNVIAYRCINEIARSVAETALVLEEGGNKLDAHALLDLLKQPNALQNGTSFMESVVSYLLISGNAFIDIALGKSGLPEALHVLRPDAVRLDVENGEKVYFYEAEGGQIRLNADNIIHLKTFHPLDDLYGLSPLEAAAFSIDQHNAAGAHNQALLQNGARPLGALVYKPSSGAMLSEDQRHDLRSQIEDHHSGALNAGRVMVLEGEFDWKEMGIKPRDMDFMDMKHSAARDIAQAFGVPPVLVGLPGDATYSNMAEARLALWEQTIIPLLGHVCSALGKLVGFFEGDLTLRFDLDAIPAIAQKRQALWEKVEASNFLTLNEKRAAVGYGPIKGGDQSPIAF